MLGKIPGVEADAFTQRWAINTWPQIDHSDRKVATHGSLARWLA